jgi:hypothetical protein
LSRFDNKRAVIVLRRDWRSIFLPFSASSRPPDPEMTVTVDEGVPAAALQ